MLLNNVCRWYVHNSGINGVRKLPACEAGKVEIWKITVVVAVMFQR